MPDLIIKDLNGWSLENWYEVSISGNGGKKIMYYTSKTAALGASEINDCGYGDDSVKQVCVLTRDGETGHLIGEEKIATEDYIKNKHDIEAAKSKLTEYEIRILGIK